MYVNLFAENCLL